MHGTRRRQQHAWNDAQLQTHTEGDADDSVQARHGGTESVKQRVFVCI